MMTRPPLNTLAKNLWCDLSMETSRIVTQKKKLKAPNFQI
jgi:hypothetical protein